MDTGTVYPCDTLIPDWARWLAQDADGTWWAYEHEPNQSHNGWYENEVGRSVRISKEEPHHQWQESLFATKRDGRYKRPG